MSNVEVMYSGSRELLCRTVYFKKTEQAYSAEKATKAKSESILHAGCLQSAFGGFDVQALAGGDKPRRYTKK
jgi:hypothetical protein